PIIASDSPPWLPGTHSGYMSAVSTRSSPASTNASSTRNAPASSRLQPNTLVPRASGCTVRPERPSGRDRMQVSSEGTRLRRSRCAPWCSGQHVGTSGADEARRPVAVVHAADADGLARRRGVDEAAVADVDADVRDAFAAGAEENEVA